MASHRFDEGWCLEDEGFDVEHQTTPAGRERLLTCTKPSPAAGRTAARSPGAPARILLAEDDADMRELLAQALAREGCVVTECCDGIQLLDHLSGLLDNRPVEPFDMIISDIRMPGLTGLEILEGLPGSKGLPPTVLITAFGDEVTHAEAKRAGAVVTLDKPFDVEALLAIVRRVVGCQHGR